MESRIQICLKVLPSLIPALVWQVSLFVRRMVAGTVSVPNIPEALRGINRLIPATATDTSSDANIVKCTW